jgi:hypothetical protein
MANESASSNEENNCNPQSIIIEFSSVKLLGKIEGI